MTAWHSREELTDLETLRSLTARQALLNLNEMHKTNGSPT